MAGINYAEVRPWSLYDLINTPLPETPQYIGRGVLPRGAKMLFGGAAKMGKSWMGLSLGRALALGIPLYNIPDFIVPEPVKVLLIEQEVGPHELQQRIKPIFLGDDEEKLKTNFFVLSGFRGFRLDDARAEGFLCEQVHKLGINVVILDPIGKMHFFDESDNSQINRLFHTIDRILSACTETGLSMVLSHHYGKPVKDPTLDWDKLDPYNFRGASKFYDDPDTLVTGFRQDGPNENCWRIRTRWILRHAPPMPDNTLKFNYGGDLRVKTSGVAEFDSGGL